MSPCLTVIFFLCGFSQAFFSDVPAEHLLLSSVLEPQNFGAPALWKCGCDRHIAPRVAGRPPMRPSLPARANAPRSARPVAKRRAGRQVTCRMGAIMMRERLIEQIGGVSRLPCAC